MPHYLLLTRSITHAQRMSDLLGRSGLKTRFFRTPVGLADRGCGYAVHIGAGQLQTAIRILRPSGLEPVRVFQSKEDGTYQEVTGF